MCYATAMGILPGYPDEASSSPFSPSTGTTSCIQCWFYDWSEGVWLDGPILDPYVGYGDRNAWGP